MSITITCEFENPYQARQAAERLRRRGYIVSQNKSASAAPLSGTLLVAYPYGNTGGNTFGNNLMGALSPIAENGTILGTTPKERRPVISVLTDDTQTADARVLLTALGGRIIQS